MTDNGRSIISGSYLRFDARLVEEAVLLGIAGRPEEREFRKMRNRIYEVEDSEKRDKGFERFHGGWFFDLGLGRPVETALREQPFPLEKTRLCAAAPAAPAQDEGADLYGFGASPNDSGGAKPAIVIKLRPASFLDATSLLRLLRRELMHLADMLEPRFGYEAFLPELGSSHANLVRERYRVLWDTWTDGRLDRRGWAAPDGRQKSWDRFLRTFSFLGAEVRDKFENLYGSGSASHHAFVEFALNPSAADPRPVTGGTPMAALCPLCRFPSYDLANAADLPPDTLHEITADYPEWRPEHGLCCQCAGLYGRERLPV